MLQPAKNSYVCAVNSVPPESSILRRLRRTTPSLASLSPFQIINLQTCSADPVIRPRRLYLSFSCTQSFVFCSSSGSGSGLNSSSSCLQGVAYGTHITRDYKFLRLKGGRGGPAGKLSRTNYCRAAPQLPRAMETTIAAPDAISTDKNPTFDRVFDQEPLLPEEDASELVPDALVWASLNGLVVGDTTVEKSGTVAGVGLVHAPLSLLPTPVPEEVFNFAVELCTLFNELVDNVSQDVDFLQQTLARAKKTDEFTAQHLAILSKITEEGVKQVIRLGLHRSDYMLDVASGNLLQVELNTMASSFAGLGTAVSKMHKYLVGLCGTRHGLNIERVPKNSANDGLAAGLARAWQEHGNRSAAILMIVQPQERNMYDQQWLSYKLMDLHGVRVLRRTLTEVNSQAKLSENGQLYIGEQAISVVYYRGGYSPNDYPSDKEWDARLLLERSTATKCPSISYHLAGTKKVQQELAKAGVLERFVNEKAASTLRKCFAGLWALEGDDGRAIVEEAINAPSGFVVKPQREGGGNNIYGDDVATKLRELRAAGGDGLAAYILMQRIFPAVHTSYLMRGGECSPNKTISELGIFGVYLRNGDREVLNEYAGHLLRTKVSGSNEGGVAAGFAVLDSPYLT